MEDLRNNIIESLDSCTCSNIRICSTADLGGRFYCAVCGELVTGVSSIGHGVTCYKCEMKGYCKWCGKKKR
jgi:hypothetical protein